MSNDLNRSERDFSQYDDMSSDQLKEILRLDAEAPEGQEQDTEQLFYVMEVLAQREQNSGHAGKTAEESFQSFKQNYMSRMDSCDTYDQTVPFKTKPWIRVASTAAAVFLVIILTTVTTNAFGVNLWDAVAKWTSETFHFGSAYSETEPSEPGKNDEMPYSSLQDTLDKNGITTALAPKWFPEGYELLDVKVTETPKQRQFLAIYNAEDCVITIQIKDYLGADPEQVEQSDGITEVYESAGVIYYIFDNYGALRTVWLNGSFECCISGLLTLDEMKMMINSIEKG